MDFLNAPAYKVQVKDVRQAQERERDRVWTLRLQANDLSFQPRHGTKSISQLFKDKEVTLNLCSVSG